MIHKIHTQKEPDLAVAGLALLALLGILIWHDNPIKSARPLDSSAMQPQYSHVMGHVYESWLWQDPFGQDHDSEGNSADDSKDKSDQPAPKPAHHDQKGKSEADGKSQCYSQIEEEIISIIKESKSVNLLASLVKVRPNTTENRELRIRYRYAMIAGLIESGYKASEPNRLHFCSIQNQGNDNKTYGLRWERFVHEGTPANKPDVILMWVDSDAVTNIESFGIFVPDYLFQKNGISKEEKNLYVFDWTNSINKENIQKIEAKYKKVKIKKPIGEDEKVAEKLIHQLVDELELRRIKKSSEIAIITEQDSDHARHLLKEFCDSFFDRVERLSRTAQNTPNNSSAGPTQCEKQNFFYLKGLDAYQQLINRRNKAEDHQAARKLTDQFSIVDLHNPPVGPAQYDYVQRLAKQIRKTRDGIDWEERVKGVKAAIIFGSDVYDKLVILQALRTEMPHIPVFTTDLDARMFHPQHWRWARNLVVASHFDLRLNESCQKHIPAFRDSQQTDIYYNTISILKGTELNQQAPEVNECHKILNSVKKAENIPPLVFEMGRNGPVLMAQNKSGTEEAVTIHPRDDSLEQAKNRYWLLFWVAVALIFLLVDFHPRSFIVFLWLFFPSLIVFGMAWSAIDSGEPLNVTEGVSLWPPILIRIIAISLTVFLFLNAVRVLESNFYRLDKKHFGGKLTTLFDDREPMSFVEYFKSSSNKNTSSQPKNNPFISFIILFVIIFSSYIYARNDLNPVGLSIWQCASFLFILIFVYWLIEHSKKIDIKSITYWIKKDNCYQKETKQPEDSCRNFIKLETCSTEKGLWEEYYEHGRLEGRWARALMMWLVFAFVETLLFYLLPSWPQPSRGEFTYLWDWGTGIMSFIAIMLLTFFVLDAVRLNFYWIKKLRKKHPLLADESLLNEEEKDALKITRSPGENPLESLEKMISLVAERTNAVDKLIYYPLLCILLILIAGTIYFDNQDFPLSKGVTFAASISLLIFSGFMIRHEARMLKLAAIKSAENLARNPAFNKAEVDAVIEKINNNDHGVFQPMLEQPVMRTLLLIVASLGLFAGEYLKLFG